MKILEYNEVGNRVIVSVLYPDGTFSTLNMLNTHNRNEILKDVYIITSDSRNRQPLEGEIPVDLETWAPPSPLPTNMKIDFYNLTGKVYDQYGMQMEVEIQFSIEGENARIENGKIIEDVVDTDTSYFIVARYENLEERRERVIYAPREVEPSEDETLQRIADLEELLGKVDNDLNALVGGSDE